MIEVRRNNQETGVFFAYHELVQLPDRWRVFASVEDHEFHQA